MKYIVFPDKNNSRNVLFPLGHWTRVFIRSEGEHTHNHTQPSLQYDWAITPRDTEHKEKK